MMNVEIVFPFRRGEILQLSATPWRRLNGAKLRGGL